VKPGKIKSSNNKIQLAPDIIYTELDDRETLLINIRKKSYYILNRISWEICRLLARGLSGEEITRRIKKQFPGLPLKQIGNIQKAISSLRRLKLVG